MDTMREALGVIAEIRDSERLRQFLLSGQDRECGFCVKIPKLRKPSWRHQSRN